MTLLTTCTARAWKPERSGASCWGQAEEASCFSLCLPKSERPSSCGLPIFSALIFVSNEPGSQIVHFGAGARMRGLSRAREAV